MRQPTEPRYTYIFDDIGDHLNPGTVHIIKHHADRQTRVAVAVKDMGFLARNLPYMPPEVADCIDVALAVYIADGFSTHYSEVRSHIHVVLPIRHPEIWQAEQVCASLERLLNWFTHHRWTFEFKLRSTRPRLPELQTCLPFTSDLVEVSLWSGGLDAFAGLHNRLLTESAVKHILFGTGGDFYMEAVQRRLANGMDRRVGKRVELIQVPLRLRQDRYQRIGKNASQRSRGFVFLMLGAVCAYLQGQRTLYVYENGIGALNLPFRPSALGRDHGVSVHPLSLRRMSHLISTVLGMEFAIVNPFMLSTKAQMCESLKYAGATDLVPHTVSCDSRRRERPMQCGCCSSCLLRRQALLAAHITDETEYTVLAELSFDKHRAAVNSSHLLAMIAQLDTLRRILQSANPWFNLVQEWDVLGKIVGETTLLEGTVPVTETQILNLYEQYVEEWNNPVILNELSRGLFREPRDHWAA